MKRFASLLLSLLMVILLLPAFSVQRADAADLSENSVRSAMLALENRYPEGTAFGSNAFYTWQGGIYSGGYGCAGFAFMLSDAAFGSLPARKYYDYSKVRVGDIIRIENNNHSVIVLYVNANSVTVAEGNYNGKVHWRREIPMSTIFNGSTAYALTRYPENTPQTAAVKGDLNGDSAISADDAQAVLQAYVRTLAGFSSGLTAEQFVSADVNDSGTVDISDAQFILIYYTDNVIAQKARTWAQIISGK